MGKEMKRTAQRDEILTKIKQFLAKEYDTWVEDCGSGEFLMPAIDNEGEEFYFKFKAVIPRGTRTSGTYAPYNGDAVIQEWKETQEVKAAEKARKEAEKARKEAEKQRLREAKKTVKKLNKDGLNKMITEGE